MSLPASIGTVEFNVPSAGKQCHTWYKIVGDLSSGITPLVAVHGGPGMCHEYLLPLRDLAVERGIPVIFYDQLGNGNSTRLRERMGDASFWTEELFRLELANLVEKLGIERYDVLGQSWGGMLGSAYASTRPEGLRRLVISNSPASMDLWAESCRGLVEALPEAVRTALETNERNGTTDSKEYVDAVMVFYERHLCRKTPFPDVVWQTMDHVADDPTVYHTMYASSSVLTLLPLINLCRNGPSEFHVIGSLKTWSVVDRLDQINVPTLIISGKYDEAQDVCVEPFARKIKGAEWVKFEESSHLCHVEERERYMQVVGDFLTL